jgi:glycerophosphoryl diester phosphodiesterase
MKKLSNILITLIIVLTACSKSEITSPEVDDFNLINTTAVDDSIMKGMEGIYRVVNGSTTLGEQFVCKASHRRITFFSEKDGIFMILKFGFNSIDGSIQYSGFWRYTELTDGGKIHGQIASIDGASQLLAQIPDAYKFAANFGSETFTIQLSKPFSDYTKNNEFMIFGHHGVQTTANPPYAENSLNGVLFDEGYGVNGLEYDIRLTKDNVPICIHDPSINTRLCQKGPLSGAWNQYSYTLLHQYIKLIDGQELPSLEKALEFFIDSTGLKYFWMDIKGDPDVFKYLEPIVRNAYSRALTANRNVIIFAGLPSDDVITEFNKQPTYRNGNPAYAFSDPLPTLCEETVDKVIANGSKFFGPRYSNGLLLDDVQRAHENGARVISWTLNSKALILDYMQNGHFDGFITDYPAYVVYDYYTLF